MIQKLHSVRCIPLFQEVFVVIQVVYLEVSFVLSQGQNLSLECCPSLSPRCSRWPRHRHRSSISRHKVRVHTLFGLPQMPSSHDLYCCAIRTTQLAVESCSVVMWFTLHDYATMGGVTHYKTFGLEELLVSWSGLVVI